MLELDKIYNINCIDGMKQLDDNSIDLIVTDPPFNISQKDLQLKRNNMKSGMFKRNSDIKLDFGKWDLFDEKDYKKFTEKWFKECSRILKIDKWFFSFFSKERVGYFTDPLNGLFNKYGLKARTIITWHKTNPVPSFRKRNFLSSCEFIVVGSKGSSKVANFLFQKEMHNFFESPNASIYKKTNHPTEKPIDLIKWIIEIGSNENDVVFDPFLGSGTTAIVCKKFNRHFIGFEVNKKYYDISLKRLLNVPERLDTWIT